MFGFSIILLITCSLVSSQGFWPSNSNENSNVNTWRRNEVSALDPNRYHYPDLVVNPPTFYFSDEPAEEAKVALKQTSENAPVEADESDEGLASTISGAVLRAINSRGGKVYRSAGIPKRDPKTRRNSNFNSNYNLNIMGHTRNHEDLPVNADGSVSPSESADGMNGDSSLGSAIDPGFYRPTYLYNLDGRWKNRPIDKGLPVYLGYEPVTRGMQMSAGILHDDEKVVEADEVIAEPTEAVAVLDYENNVTTDQTPIGSRSWGGANTNRNVNWNNFSPSGYRRNANNNMNQNVFRRNLNANSNSNVNGYRRSNANYNMNSNFFNPHNRRN